MDKHKIVMAAMLASMLFSLSGCIGSSGTDEISDSETSSSSSTSESPSTSQSSIDYGVIGEVTGIAKADSVIGHYFNPLKGIKAYSTTGIDITSYIDVSGYVDYGTPGEYTLTYTINYQDDVFSKSRVVSVASGTYVAPVTSKTPNGLSSVNVGMGSYRTGYAGSLAGPLEPNYLEADLLDKAVPTNGWWTTLITSNYGGGNGIYLNPLRSSLSSSGVEITNVGKGFVQYWNATGNPTMAQFSPFYQDLMLKAGTLQSSSISKVIDYSDNNVKVALRNSLSSEDEMVVTYTQGSPYIFTEYKDKNDVSLCIDNKGVSSYQYFDVSGNEIVSHFVGDAIVVKMSQRHIGYITSRPNIVGGGTYEDRYFIVNAPKDTSFSISNNTHPAGFMDKVTMDLGTGNYLSVAAIKDLSEAAFYHDNGYAFMAASNIDYSVDHFTNLVTTSFRNNVQYMSSGKSSSGILALLPHQYKNSGAALTAHQIRTVRGTLKMMEGNSFTTRQSFYGVLPSFTLPDDGTFSVYETTSYLADLDQRTDPLGTYEDGGKNYIDAPGPYWNGKALYPLSQGLIIADQIGNSLYKASFIAKLEMLLSDWYTYNPSKANDRYLYYNQRWGTMYYSNNDFATASELSDHHFTHDYLIFATAVLSMYDHQFYSDYSGMADLLLKDYLNYDDSDASFPKLRSFDGWAGHSWAHGYGSFTEGNNQESSGEALNSWVAGYLLGLADGNPELVDAAIYGFTTELYSIKQYWFNYDNDNWSDEYADYASVAGMIWGGKFDYATWFGSDPTFIYGIHWLPTGEYVSSYALGTADQDRLKSIYAKYLEAIGGAPDTWYSNMWAVQSLVSPSIALHNFEANKILADDYPNELVGSFWMIHALQNLKMHSREAYMEANSHVASSVYETGNAFVALIWNPSSTAQTVSFHLADATVKTVSVAAYSFTSITL